MPETPKPSPLSELVGPEMEALKKRAADPLQIITELEALCPKRPWKMWDGWGPDNHGDMHAVRFGPQYAGGIETSDHAKSDLRGTREDMEAAAHAINTLPAALEALRRAIEPDHMDTCDSWSCAECGHVEDDCVCAEGDYEPAACDCGFLTHAEYVLEPLTRLT